MPQQDSDHSNTWLESTLKQIPNLPQRQDSTQLQLQDLVVIANKLGLYDAADIIKHLQNSNTRKSGIKQKDNDNTNRL